MRRKLLFVLIIFFLLPLETALAKEVTLKEKIGQMLIVGFKGTELSPEDPIAKAILAQEIGGVILFNYDNPTKTYHRNIVNPVQLKHLTQQLQTYTSKAATEHQNQLAPLLVAIDYEGGKVDRLKQVDGFPATFSAADVGSMAYKQVDQYAQQMAETLKEEGINVNLSVVLDVNVNPDSPIIGKLERSFSSDPQKVAKYAAIFSRAYQKQGIACAYKHFPGHGSATGDTHAGFVDVTQTWKQYELEPYRKLFIQPESCSIVMTAHIVHYGLDPKGYPASISNAISQKLLRENLGFKGLIITDDLQMKAIADHYGVSTAVRLAINAGADMLVFANQMVPIPQDPQKIIDIIYQDVMKGNITKSRIDEAYQRIMQLKYQLLPEN